MAIDEGNIKMTIDTRHPREGASQNISAVRGALESLREQVISILHGYGVDEKKVDAFGHKWQHEIDRMLREVERQR
jgi:hypothetical protein